MSKIYSQQFQTSCSSKTGLPVDFGLHQIENMVDDTSSCLALPDSQ